ncbi:MAG: 30S ribosomal protein S16 [Gammaproteobacteria bacterium]|nr:30S ribosomal protein S16 [Gammaproteobacteria bacterium]
MVVIRLSRAGAKKRPFYHIVVTNSRNARDGRYIERLGYYNPNARGNDVRIQMNQERAQYWTDKGAQPSEKVAYLIKNFAEIASGKIEEQKTEERAKKDAVKAKAAKEAAAKVEAETKAAAEPKEEPKAEKAKEEPKAEEPKAAAEPKEEPKAEEAK